MWRRNSPSSAVEEWLDRTDSLAEPAVAGNIGPSVLDSLLIQKCSAAFLTSGNLKESLASLFHKLTFDLIASAADSLLAFELLRFD